MRGERLQGGEGYGGLEGVVESYGGGLGGVLADVVGTATVMDVGERRDLMMKLQCMFTLRYRD